MKNVDDKNPIKFKLLVRTLNSQLDFQTLITYEKYK